jgi:hypothetical protein
MALQFGGAALSFNAHRRRYDVARDLYNYCCFADYAAKIRINAAKTGI